MLTELLDRQEHGILILGGWYALVLPTEQSVRKLDRVGGTIRHGDIHTPLASDGDEGDDCEKSVVPCVTCLNHRSSRRTLSLRGRAIWQRDTLGAARCDATSYRGHLQRLVRRVFHGESR